jgi:hypothetical protein
MQIQHSGSFYQNFGGINFTDAHFGEQKFGALPVQHLVACSVLAEYDGNTARHI